MQWIQRNSEVLYVTFILSAVQNKVFHTLSKFKMCNFANSFIMYPEEMDVTETAVDKLCLQKL
jgi:hypothetical protein